MSDAEQALREWMNGKDPADMYFHNAGIMDKEAAAFLAGHAAATAERIRAIDPQPIVEQLKKGE